MPDRWQELSERLAQVSQLHHVSALLAWDQQTCMPVRGASARAEQLGLLDRIAHERFTSDAIGELLESLSPEAAAYGYDSDKASLLRVTRRDYDKARRVPSSLIEGISRASALGLEAWDEARTRADFAIFLPHLERIVQLEIELANHLGYREHVYDALLDQYEPEMTTAQVKVIFDQLRRGLIPLVQAIASMPNSVDDRVLHRSFDPQKQWDFGLDVIRRFGFNFEAGRQDKSAHPFTAGFSLDDVRITTCVVQDYFPTALYSTMHECGHGLYDQGYRRELENTPLEGGASLGVHESQSRLWENLVGRSREFCEYFFPRMQHVFPQALADQNVESFYRAVNLVKPSLIRVDADEVTYNLHVLLRFEIEQELVEGRLRAADVPDAWRAKMKEYLGLEPPDDAQGALQDIHWALANLGYFPTYSLGNILSVQLYDRALQDLPELPVQMGQGEFSGLLGWLRKNVHTHGRKFTIDELARRVTGRPLESQTYLRYLRKKYGEIYGL